jgi:four helix bundle protein
MKEEGTKETSNGRPRDIRVRTMEYGLRAIRLYRYLLEQRDDAARILGRQFLRAATSIGANLVEAQAGESRRDFIHKCGIAQKEARECKYWLELLKRSSPTPSNRFDALIDETEQIISILTRILVNTKKRRV